MKEFELYIVFQGGERTSQSRDYNNTEHIHFQ